jgi:hypothetical protein
MHHFCVPGLILSVLTHLRTTLIMMLELTLYGASLFINSKEDVFNKAD